MLRHLDLEDLILRAARVLDPRAKLAEFEATGVDVLLFAPLPIHGAPLEPRFLPLFEEFSGERAAG